MYTFSIPAVITQILIPTTELIIQTGNATNEAYAEFETKPVIVEVTLGKCSI